MTASAKSRPLAVAAAEVAPRSPASNYPEPFFSRMAKREKRRLGDVFGLTAFGVNLTRLAPGGESALLHIHSKQQEFVYVLEGEVVLATDAGETTLTPGMCAGFPPDAFAHHLINRTDKDAVFLEVGDRVAGDEGSYPDDDIKAVMDAEGQWSFVHKDGTPY